MNEVTRMERKDIVDVRKYLLDNPGELVVSVYEKLSPGVICSFPIDDAVLYAENITCKEISPFMDPKYSSFKWPLIWAKIRRDRESAC